jgi:hypothetical protein
MYKIYPYLEKKTQQFIPALLLLVLIKEAAAGQKERRPGTRAEAKWKQVTGREVLP